MLPYRSVKPLLYVAMFSLYVTAFAFELYIFVLLKGYGEVQTDAAGIVTASTTTLTVVAIVLATGLWLHKHAPPYWVKRLKQHEAQRRTQHHVARQSALDHVRQYIPKDERRSNGFFYEDS